MSSASRCISERKAGFYAEMSDGQHTQMADSMINKVVASPRIEEATE